MHKPAATMPSAQKAAKQKVAATQNGDADVSDGDEAEAEQDALTQQQQSVLQNDSDTLKFDLDQRETADFVNYFKFFTAVDENGNPKRGRRAFEHWLDNARPYLPYVRQVLRDKGLPEDLVVLPFAESGYNPTVTSSAGACGMWQFMPYTARKYGLEVDWWIDERRDPYKATGAAVTYLSNLYEMFGDWYLALAAYNAGEGKISRVIQKSGTNDYFEICKTSEYLKAETRRYVPKFLALCKIVRHLKELGFEPIDWDQGAEVTELKVKGGTDLMALARSCNMSWSKFADMNPAFRRTVSPPEHEASIWIPTEQVAYAKAYLAKPEARPFAGYVRYHVRSGDSWWAISHRFEVPISVLRKLNNELASTLHPGQEVMVPGQNRAEAVASADDPQPRGRHASASKAESASAKTRSIAAKRANYKVKNGDTIWDIATRYEVSVDTLLAANGMKNGRHLRVGQKLYIPSVGEAETREQVAKAKGAYRETTYHVQQGDTVWAIARKYNVNPTSILSRNNLDHDDVLQPGQSLRIRLE
ncbi:LysM peptidoglycan-binding domain-containing protein [Desulfovibrio sp. X2]|uniref:LysM peptidoglycan-binding domain-containing protein n=1 Tax=Desulfovibrio sp. X2 TaxID=941449 RepID=UPI001F22A3C2|nr:LysM peptidoglycan-binding domain-containing protein [Desulfovibrio sp. X2]